jgi:hypothetical protein
VNRQETRFISPMNPKSSEESSRNPLHKVDEPEI